MSAAPCLAAAASTAVKALTAWKLHCSVTGSTVGGNLGGDTIKFGGVVKNAAIYGGGGFEYDTSLDGADSISLGSKLSASALIQANGGNDTIYIAGDILGSTAYGGQGNDTISGAAAQSLSGSLLAGNRGDDKIDFSASTNSVFNTKVYGSDETGTLAGNDSIVLGGYTVQTSTVYGGAGADTLFIGDTSGDDNLAVQILKTDIQAFAGNDSIAAGGSFVSTTVKAGEGNDTLFVNATQGTASASTEFYAGAGNDFVTVMNGQGITIYGDTSAQTLLVVHDSLSISGFVSSTVYGAAGGDTLILEGGRRLTLIWVMARTTPPVDLLIRALPSWVDLVLTSSS